jgi:hypothetical protein
MGNIGMFLVIFGVQIDHPYSYSVYQGVLPALVQENNPESPIGRAYGAMFDNMCRVVSACLPIFDQAMHSLRQGVPGGWGPSR